MRDTNPREIIIKYECRKSITPGNSALSGIVESEELNQLKTDLLHSFRLLKKITNLMNTGSTP